MAFCPPCPKDIIAMTELMPIIIPNMVRKDRILLDMILINAILTFSIKFILSLL